MTKRSMNSRKAINAALMLLLVVSGCDHPPDADLSPIMAPIRNRDAEANIFRESQQTDEQLASLAITQAKCDGDLLKLLDHPKWSGHRLRVTGTSNGLPVTENIGPWHIMIVPTPDQSVVEIKGLLFAQGFAVKLDMNRDVLIINDAEFEGRQSQGNSPMFQNAAFQGVHFERNLGLVMGSASILFLEDGRVSMDFHKVMVNGSRAGEYGVLEARAENN